MSTATNDAGTATINWSTSRAADTRIDWGTNSTTLDQKLVIAEQARQHKLELRQFTPGATYYYRVRCA